MWCIVCDVLILWDDCKDDIKISGSNSYAAYMKALSRFVLYCNVLYVLYILYCIVCNVLYVCYVMYCIVYMYIYLFMTILERNFTTELSNISLYNIEFQRFILKNSFNIYFIFNHVKLLKRQKKQSKLLKVFDSLMIIFSSEVRLEKIRSA